MLKINNVTPYPAEGAVLADKNGAQLWVIVAKVTFTFGGGNIVIAEHQDPVRLEDEFHGEPGLSSPKYPADLVGPKPGTDVIINGSAYSPGNKPVKQTIVRARVGHVHKRILVLGDRIWKSGLTDLIPSEPERFERMPLAYERAYGGQDTSAQDPAKHAEESRNPVGTGFGLSASFLKGKALPNLEDPDDRIRSRRCNPQPMSFGTIARHWEPRRTYAGNYDQRWAKERAPLFPKDFDERFFHAAPPDQVAVPHLRGGEPVELDNLSPDGVVRFQLPRIALGFRSLLDGEWIDHRCVLASVLIEPDLNRLVMAWHTALECTKRKYYLEKTLVCEK